MGIKEDYLTYTDSDGMISPSTDVSDNGIRFSTEYLFALNRWGMLSDGDKEHFRELFGKCEKEPGLLMRYPGATTRLDSPDNAIAAIAADSLIGTGFSKRFLQYGETKEITSVDYETEWGQKPANLRWGGLVFKTLKLLGLCKYVYNTPIPNKFNLSAWLGRQLPLIAHARLVARGSLSFIDRLCWCIGVLVSTFGKDQDGKILGWMMVMASRNRRSLAMKFSCKLWSRMLRLQYADGVGGVLSAYFDNDEHPSVIYLKGEFGE